MSPYDTTPTPELKVCTRCHEALPESAYGIESRLPGGRALQCKPCRNTRNKRNAGLRNFRCARCHKETTPDDRGTGGYCKACQKVYLAEYYAKNRDRLLAKQRTYYEDNREHSIQREKAKRLRIRMEVLAEYGGACQCCGESEPHFLAIDHSFNDGKQHRAACGHASGGTRFYYWLKKRGFPQDEGLRVLCHNCNMAIGFYGSCPHEQEPAA